MEKRKVMIIDDDRKVSDELKEVLRASGYDVLVLCKDVQGGISAGRSAA